MVSLSSIAVATAALLSSATLVHGHGFLVKPKPFFKSGVDITSYTGTIMGDAMYPGYAFNTAPSINMANFVKNFQNDTRHPNLKTLIEKNQKVVAAGADAKCGWTDPSKTSEALEGNTIVYGRNFEGTGEGFVHPGPCETWCDDEMVQQNMHCDEAYNVVGKAAIIPIDAAKCRGAKQLTTYWIAMHGNEWQIYLDCVGLSGATSGGSSASTSKPASGPKTTPKPTTSAPKPADSDVDNDGDEYPGETPAAATPAPKTPAPKATAAPKTPAPNATTAPKTTAPSPSKKKCTGKTSRRLMREQTGPTI